jgi:hypothetical protein
MSSKLDDQLLDTLAHSYVAKGVPLPKLLDNPVFYKAPLDKRLAVLKKYTPGSHKPTVTASHLLGHIGVGAVTGLTAMLARGASPSKIAIGAGVGGLLGAISPTMTAYSNLKRDKTSYNLLKHNRFLEAIADRSMKQGIPSSPVNISKLIGKAEDNVYLEIAHAKL